MKKTYRYTLTIAYEGTHYYGWQEQLNLPSIAQTMQETFSSVFGKPAQLLGASRTDAGVHALGQVALLRTDIMIEPKKMMNAWNNALPTSIVIRSLALIDDLFHPHHAILYKTYMYHFFLMRPLPFLSCYGWFYRRELDREKLQLLVDVFVGTHDFSAFFTGDPIGGDPICTINSITFEYIKRFGVYRLTFNGNRFMRHMVRRLVGALLYAASHNEISKNDLISLLLKKSPLIPFETAPAHGLLLYKIVYKINS